ncbi:hypothetical protein MKQ68_15185 [Chitinophaga horti]|uniref:Gliding motility protein GldL n=1 Tax=Chitinophaga horti TaxID=2920382 RepID=A0ABY6IVX5_9BACT|nr:hypothetical protein [Chitinophaga horti]UYQ91435.1 hypothetical protein MKQ68_15185 [Chitinophaga horti]
MKKILLSGLLLGVVLISLGVLWKVNHWSGASMLLNLSLAGFGLFVICGVALVLKSITAAKG